MEVVLNALYQIAGTGTWYDKYWKGQVRLWFSLEIVSIEGNIRFFIRAHKKFKNLIESQIYSQYPGVEILDVSEENDYVNFVRFFRGGEWKMFGVEWNLAKEDYLPIKTYVDYGLDKDPKEEFKIDPLSSVVETLGAMRSGEQFWYQVLVRAVESNWKKDGETRVNEMMGKDASGKPVEGKDVNELKLTQVERDLIKAIERNISKLGFECGVRALYLAKEGSFNPNHIQGILSLMRVFGSNLLNSFGYSHVTGFNYPWQDYKNIRMDDIKTKLFKAYVLRSYFYPNYEGRSLSPFEFFNRPTFVLNAEELATIYHFPGSVVSTPTMERIPSAKSEPPPNLPI